jgi:hypothetical protein
MWGMPPGSEWPMNMTMPTMMMMHPTPPTSPHPNAYLNSYMHHVRSFSGSVGGPPSVGGGIGGLEGVASGLSGSKMMSVAEITSPTSEVDIVVGMDDGKKIADVELGKKEQEEMHESFVGLLKSSLPPKKRSASYTDVAALMSGAGLTSKDMMRLAPYSSNSGNSSYPNSNPNSRPSSPLTVQRSHVGSTLPSACSTPKMRLHSSSGYIPPSYLPPGFPPSMVPPATGYYFSPMYGSGMYANPFMHAPPPHQYAMYPGGVKTGHKRTLSKEDGSDDTETFVSRTMMPNPKRVAFDFGNIDTASAKMDVGVGNSESKKRERDDETSLDTITESMDVEDVVVAEGSTAPSKMIGHQLKTDVDGMDDADSGDETEDDPIVERLGMHGVDSVMKADDEGNGGPVDAASKEEGEATIALMQLAGAGH